MPHKASSAITMPPDGVFNGVKPYLGILPRRAVDGRRHEFSLLRGLAVVRRGGCCLPSGKGG